MTEKFPCNIHSTQNDTARKILRGDTADGKNNFNTVKNYFSFRECLEILKIDKNKGSKGNKCTKAINASVDKGNSTGLHP